MPRNLRIGPRSSFQRLHNRYLIMSRFYWLVASIAHSYETETRGLEPTIDTNNGIELGATHTPLCAALFQHVPRGTGITNLQLQIWNCNLFPCPSQQHLNGRHKSRVAHNLKVLTVVDLCTSRRGSGSTSTRSPRCCECRQHPKLNIPNNEIHSPLLTTSLNQASSSSQASGTSAFNGSLASVARIVAENGNYTVKRTARSSWLTTNEHPTERPSES
jgi:hypothetical protein